MVYHKVGLGSLWFSFFGYVKRVKNNMAAIETSKSPNEDGSIVDSNRSLPSAENPKIRSLKSADVKTMVSPPSGRSSATGRSLSPDTRSSPAALEFEEYR